MARQCSRDSLPVRADLGIPNGITAGVVPNFNATRAAMAVCCASNEVHVVYDDCVLWCELPDEIAKADNQAGALRQCLKSVDRGVVNETVITGVESGSVVTAKPLSLGVLGSLALLASVVFNFAG